MSTGLPSTSTLLSDSWQWYRKHFADTLRLSLWFALIPLVTLLASYPTLSRTTFVDAQLIPTLDPLMLVGLVITIAIDLIVSIRLLNFFLSANRDDKPSTIKLQDVWKYALPFLWIQIISSVIILGASLLLILPGIWIAVRYAFAPYTLLEDNQHGTAALSASEKLVHGRWWPVFNRLFGIGLAFTFTYLVSILFVTWALNGFAFRSTALNATTLWTMAATDIFSGFILALLLPLYFMANVKLFHALKTQTIE